MAAHTKSLSLLILLSAISFTIGGRYISEPDLIRSTIEQGGGKKKLFLFGDSYLDTGNGRQGQGGYNKPYGITFPGQPTGRFSDGRCLTDYLASFLGIETLVPYMQKDNVDKLQWQNGMNFAFGGAGVFDTTWMLYNLSVQLNYFKELINQNVYTSTGLESAIAFIHISGNDYSTYLSNHTEKEVVSYMPTVIHQLSTDLQNLHDLGVPKILVSMMPPAGCSPQNANKSSNYPENCNQVVNSNVQKHNQLLQEAVEKLNNGTQKPAFVVIDMYNAFSSAMDQHAKIIENPEYKNPTIECCKGTDPTACGSVDKAGNPKYTLCDHPELSFFWDMAHPSQHGWSYVFSALENSLSQLLQDVTHLLNGAK